MYLDEDKSEEEVDLTEWKGFFSVNEIDNMMPELKETSGRSLPFHHHAARLSLDRGPLLQIHLAMGALFKELAFLGLSHQPHRKLYYCDRPDQLRSRSNEVGADLTKKIEDMKKIIIGSIYVIEDVAFILPPNGEEPIKVGNGDGKYVFVFQMLIGEENLDRSLPAGATYGILRNPGMDNEGNLKVSELHGNSLVGAGYLVIASNITFACAYQHKSGTHLYTWDRGVAEFLQRIPDFTIPTKGDIFSINNAYTIGWSEAVRLMLARFRDPIKMEREGKHVYTGCSVSDHHTVNLEGGLFLAPATQLNPHGSMLLIHECWPLGYVTREAGGFATNGRGSIFEVRPTSLQGKTPYFGGSIDDVFQIMQVAMWNAANNLDKGCRKTRETNAIVEMPWTWQEYQGPLGAPEPQ